MFYLKWISVAVFSLVVLSTVFWFVRSKGRVPSMPRTAIEESEQQRAMQALMARTRDFKWKKSDLVVKQKLTDLHQLETQDQNALDRASAIKGKIVELKESMQNATGGDTERLLLLGDAFAVQFHRALKNLLAIMKQRGQKGWAEKENAALRVTREKGGSFFERARKRGVIDDDGSLHVSEMTPQVLFRYRWRHMAGLDWDRGLLPAEKKAYFDFIVRFSSKSAVRERLSAVEGLHELDKTYEREIARAIIFVDGQEISAARSELKSAIANRRSTTTAQAFLNALSE